MYLLPQIPHNLFGRSAQISQKIWDIIGKRHYWASIVNATEQKLEDGHYCLFKKIFLFRVPMNPFAELEMASFIAILSHISTIYRQSVT